MQTIKLNSSNNQLRDDAIKLSSAIFITLLAITSLSLAIGASTMVNADTNTSVEDTVTINIDSACTLSGVVPSGSEHTASITPGQNVANIGTTNMTAICNDAAGYDIYAVGYSNDEWKNTNLISTQGSTTYNIATGTATSGSTSNWSMKLAQGTGDAATIVTTPVDYSNYANIPSDYTKVAHYPASTAGTSGTSFTTTYQVFASTSQTAGTYTGKVKYTLVHPHVSDDSNKPEAADPKIYMQDLDSTSLATLLPNIGDTATVYDNRDEEEYLIGKLADGKYWMLDNLRLDPTAVDLATLQGKTNASDTTLTYFKNGGGTSPYTTTAVSNAWISSSQNSYSLPYINAASKDTTVTSYGSGSGKVGVYYNYCAASAGSYCYASGSGTGNASEDLCPTNWRMPTGGDSGEYQALYTAYSSNDADFRSALSTPLSGDFSSGSAYDQGSSGYFWSSTYSGRISMRYLSVDSNNVSPSNNDRGRSLGYSLRCILSS